TEIWISEAQERMILAVPPTKWPEVSALCSSEDVEATVLGQFEATGKLRLNYHQHQVADLDLHFFHEGRPQVVRQARIVGRARKDPDSTLPTRRANKGANLSEALLKILSSYNVCSKEWIIRQYDHEVQGGSVLKPLVGIKDDGPGDAA